MSKLTNRLNLPEILLYAVRNDKYNSGDSWRTVTQLIAPPRIIQLQIEHAEEITEDVVDRLYTMQGQIAHGIIERASQELKDHGWISEERLFTEVLGKKVSGAFDLYHPKNRELIDVKYASGWSAKKGEAKPEWVNQTNLLAHLLRLHGHKVAQIKVLLLIRDWSKPEARRNPDYPQDPALYLSVPVWDDLKCAQFLKERVALHLKAEQVLPDCTAEERWAKPDIWAIKKNDGAKAISGGLYTDELIAKKELIRLGSNHKMEYRRGESTRCELYCSAAPFCTQFKRSK